MTLIEKFYPVMKPWLFRLDAERAHTLTVKMMIIAHRLGMLKSVVDAPQQPRTVMGLSFPNVLGLAAGMDKSASAVEAWAAPAVVEILRANGKQAWPEVEPLTRRG